MENNRLFLLDAYALIYRAYYALIRAPRITSKGFNTSAIFGFCNTLEEILTKQNPTHIAVCFDPKGGHTFRHDAYPDYKAQRDKQPEDITMSIPYIKEILEAYHIPVIEREGFEADDVIGTLSRRAEAEGFETYMMTPDKDYGQLVSDKVFMYRPALRGEGFEIRGSKEVCDRYGIKSPSQVIDLLALEGDASDNVPGCPGVGEKTAQKLIAEWGSVENMLENVDNIKGALGRKIADNAEQIKFSKFLVTIKTDVPLEDVTIESLRRQQIDKDRLLKVYRELEFRTFINRLSSRQTEEVEATAVAVESGNEGGMGSLFDMPAEPSRPSMDDSKYTIMTAAADVSRLVKEAIEVGTVGLAIYGIGEEAMTARLAGLAIALPSGESTFVHVTQDSTALLDVLKSLFEAEVTIACHDVKRCYLMLRRVGIAWQKGWFDTAVAHYLLDPEMKHDVEQVAMSRLELSLAHGAGDSRKPYPISQLEGNEARLRYCEEASIVLKLMPVLRSEIEMEGMVSLLEDVEFPLIKVLADMEWNGVRIDNRELAGLHVKLTARVEELEQKVYEMAGMVFNISSPMQVGEVLFEKLKLDPKAKKTSKGAYSTTEQILEKYRAAHPIVDYILKIRRLRKLLATYIDALPRLVNPATGKIHTSYNQTVTATGRISSTNPNLQNIPIRTDDGRDIRRAFIADDGDLLMSADYSQIELRLIADISRDPDMVEAFLSGADIHTATASKIYHEPIESVTEDQRRRAKTANFGIIYGISAFGLSERLSIPRSEAKELIEGYFVTYPHIKEYLERCVVKAREDGFVSTIMGRKRRLPEINSRNAVVRGYAERNAVNAPIQGSAADIIKIAMVNVARHIEEKGLKSRMIMQVHDELIFNVKPEELDALKEIVMSDMANAYHGLVPLEVACGVASNWLDAH